MFQYFNIRPLNVKRCRHIRVSNTPSRWSILVQCYITKYTHMWWWGNILIYYIYRKVDRFRCCPSRRPLATKKCAPWLPGLVGPPRRCRFPESGPRPRAPARRSSPGPDLVFQNFEIGVCVLHDRAVSRTFAAVVTRISCQCVMTARFAGELS